MAQPPGTSRDGYEIQFAVNHLAHALIIKKLLPVLIRTADKGHPDVRIVSLTSVGWKGHPRGGIRFETLRTEQDMGLIGPWKRYGQSKLANNAYAAELARRYPAVTAVSVHPGVVETGLVGSQPFWHKVAIYVGTGWGLVNVQEGTLNKLWAAAGAAGERKVRSGGYYLPVGVSRKSTLDGDARDLGLTKRLWEFTEEALEGF